MRHARFQHDATLNLWSPRTPYRMVDVQVLLPPQHVPWAYAQVREVFDEAVRIFGPFTTRPALPVADASGSVRFLIYTDPARHALVARAIGRWLTERFARPARQNAPRRQLGRRVLAPEGTPPGFPYPCEDDLVGQRVSGRDFAGRVIGCATPPEGKRGRRLWVGGSAVSRARVMRAAGDSARARADLVARWSGPDHEPTVRGAARARKATRTPPALPQGVRGMLPAPMPLQEPGPLPTLPPGFAPPTVRGFLPAPAPVSEPVVVSTTTREPTEQEVKVASELLADLAHYQRFGVPVFARRVALHPDGRVRVEFADAYNPDEKTLWRPLATGGLSRFGRATDAAEWATLLDLRYAPPQRYVPGPVAEPWQRTQAEAVKASGYKAAKWIERAKGEHISEVVAALRASLPVPASVLAAYPGLVAVYGSGAEAFSPPAMHTDDPDLVLAHSAEQGTTITTRPDERTWNDTIKNLGMGFKWWREGKRWYRSQSRGFAVPSVPLEVIASRLASAGARVKVESIHEVSASEAAEIRREHLSERAERYEQRAAVAAEKLAAMEAPMKAPTSQIPPDVLGVLRASTLDDNRLVLPSQLDRALYLKTNKVLETLGATWNRKAQAHVLSQGAQDAIRAALASGEVTYASDLGFFRTPPELAADLVARAGVTPGMRVLEPSAGDGALVAPLLAAGAEVVAVEFEPNRAAVLRARFPGLTVVEGDFLAQRPGMLGAPFDAVVMNPPFSLPGRPQADQDHVEHALAFVRPGGLVVAILSAGVEFRGNARTEAFRALVEQSGGWLESLPEGTFRVSGTDVRAVVATLPRRVRETARASEKEETREERKLREQREKVEHLERVARGRRREAASLAPVAQERLAAGNDYVDALGERITKNLKRDVGAERVRGHASAGAARHRSFTVIYPAAANLEWQTIRVFPQHVEMGAYAGVPHPIDGAETPESAYAAILARLPRATVDPSAPVDPRVFPRAFVEYANRRVKRDSGAAEVQAIPRTGSVRLYFPKVDPPWWSIEATPGVVTIHRGREVKEPLDVQGMTVPEAYKAAIARLNAMREPRTNRPGRRR